MRRLDDDRLAAVDVQLRADDGATTAALRAAAGAMSQRREFDRLSWSVAAASPVADVPALVSVDLESLRALGECGDAPADATGRRAIVVITEESLSADPARTLREVSLARAAGHAIAVDGVGERPRAVALLPVVRPDLVLLAPRMVAERADSRTASAAHAVAAHVERTGALVVATGVDTPLHRRRALGLGATYGTGELYPAAADPALLGASATDPFPVAAAPGATESGTSPWRIASVGKQPVRSLKRLLVTMSTTLEVQAAASGPETLVLGTFQRAEHFTPAACTRWQVMADRVAYCGIYGVGMEPNVLDGIHRAPIDESDDLVEEWNVVVLGPHFACVLSARDLHSGSGDADREFDYVVSYDRDVVERCARSVLDRFGSAEAAEA
ncbi:EAL domain-containing protein [Rhodococcus rhodnii]|uniref:Diguanylate phosphodiesterase n=3 Tax=Rhodococcus rhodnii TaxID=38312 RepID=R7WNM4_9NOCA|nr:hypothetical protein Rrhod_1820 [Rhodococcus rhodnii LMG 5362]TXG92430.1 EAL domain-containing protein [Rhodococcus rhodnii]